MQLTGENGFCHVEIVYHDKFIFIHDNIGKILFCMRMHNEYEYSPYPMNTGDIVERRSLQEFSCIGIKVIRITGIWQWWVQNTINDVQHLVCSHCVLHFEISLHRINFGIIDIDLWVGFLCHPDRVVAWKLRIQYVFHVFCLFSQICCKTILKHTKLDTHQKIINYIINFPRTLPIF